MVLDTNMKHYFQRHFVHKFNALETNINKIPYIAEASLEQSVLGPASGGMSSSFLNGSRKGMIESSQMNREFLPPLGYYDVNESAILKKAPDCKFNGALRMQDPKRTSHNAEPIDRPS